MERIIELVRKYPILYDLSHEDYKNVRKKDKIWTRIGEEIGENESEAFPNIESPENILTDENSAVQKPTCSKNLLTTQTDDSQNKIQPPSSKPTRNEAPRVTLSNETPSTGRTNRKRNSEPSTSVKDMISYFESKKRVVHDATDQLFLAHASTVKSFSPRRQIETKMKIAQVIMEQELLQWRKVL
ncbi:uncharacterized protein [Diabrotica undecimpunctata]|uniref:uncharacterized protein n=1 Tax=Diabrotica undecimpunctata TaxID=50387 RepID=UPI003B640E69